MILDDIKQLKTNLPEGKRLLCIDHGSKTLGLAVSNSKLTASNPLFTIKKTKFTKDLLELKKVCEEYNIGGLIIGLPLNMDGTEGARTESVRHYAANIINAKETLGFDPVIAFCDERLSTHAAQDLINEENQMRRKKRGQVIDSLAAHAILQDALHQINT